MSRAGTPEEGVGMFVNADGQEGEVETASLVDAANSLKDGLLEQSEVLHQRLRCLIR
jgi:hypothetical protein